MRLARLLGVGVVIALALAGFDADAKGGKIPGVRTPITINGRRAAADRAPPKVGEHTQEVLREIGEA